MTQAFRGSADVSAPSRPRLGVYAMDLFSGALMATDVIRDGRDCSLEEGFDVLTGVLRPVRGDDASAYLCGNGGALATASHIATDLNIAGRRAQAIADPAMVTTAGNDAGFDQSFACPVRWLARKGDILLAMSCSGQSPNVLAACRTACEMGLFVITFSGFGRDNQLFGAGHLNFWVPSRSYGHVQIAHETILHAAVDAIARG
jgi:D-sedoheptulose 7-phosphate isomerase